MNEIISLIAIDMGAKNTAVYYAKYPKGTSFCNQSMIMKLTLHSLSGQKI